MAIRFKIDSNFEFFRAMMEILDTRFCKHYLDTLGMFQSFDTVGACMRDGTRDSKNRVDPPFA
jgi:hypothetical protein